MASISNWSRVLKRQVAQGCQDVLASHWSVAQTQAACHAQGYAWRDRIWTPWQTLWTFLWQVLYAGSSCRDAVALGLAQQAAGDAMPQVSVDPTAYCQARKRLPLAVLQEGLRVIGQRLAQQVGQAGRWCGRRAWLVDGTTCSMPDTPDLQKAFGQPDGQAEGCGFPVAKIVAMFCWASGAVLEAAIGPCALSELWLWRSLWHLLSAGDVVVADRFYCTFADLAGLKARRCDGVFRLHHQRSADFRQGKPLGKNDRLVTWLRPTYQSRPRGMNRRQWQALPETLTIRLLRFTVDIPGFRCRSIVVATSLLDPLAYSAEQIAALYRDRWLIELRFRDIKITLGMDVLRGKSADVVRKEIHMHLLAYNLIRCLMWQAACDHGRNLHRLSFAGTISYLHAVGPFLWLLRGTDKARYLQQLLLQWIARDPNPDRPNRIEPRAVKRRPKKYSRLIQPRRIARKALLV